MNEPKVWSQLALTHVRARVYCNVGVSRSRGRFLCSRFLRWTTRKNRSNSCSIDFDAAYAFLMAIGLLMIDISLETKKEIRRLRDGDDKISQINSRPSDHVFS